MPPQNSAKTIAATAAVTLVLAGIAFVIFQKIKKWKQENKINSSFRKQEATVTHEEFDKFRGRVKGLVVDEAGKEVLYMRKLKHGELKATFPKIVLDPNFEDDEAGDEEKSIGISVSARPQTKPPPPPPIPAAAAALPVVPPPPPPPPPPPVHHPSQATLPPIRANRMPMRASPPPKALNLASPLKPPVAPKGNADKNTEGALAEESSNRTVVGYVKLKPLHWDKVATNVDHSLVWNEIKDGSLR